jgi:hypothetical protein
MPNAAKRYKKPNPAQKHPQPNQEVTLRIVHLHAAFVTSVMCSTLPPELTSYLQSPVQGAPHYQRSYISCQSSGIGAGFRSQPEYPHQVRPHVRLRT